MQTPKPGSELAAEGEYLREVVRRLRELLGVELVGVYGAGSWSLGDYRRGRSDLDVAAVVAGSLSSARKLEIAERLRASSLPCPARGLELVVYRLATARSSGAEPDFEVNLNSGAGLPELFEERPGGGPGFWFPIDRDMLHQRGIALYGPPASEVFAAVEQQALLSRLVEAVRWQRREARPQDAVLNACRALRYARERAWYSKAEAGEWALEREALPAAVVRVALGGRDGDSAALGADTEPALAAAERELREAAALRR